jgi:hypothetical protein
MVNANSVRLVRSVSDGLAQSWPGTVTYDNRRQSAQFMPQQPFEMLPSVTRLYTRTVLGGGPDHRILDGDGPALDSNGAGSPGGNFTSTFAVDRLLR